MTAYKAALGTRAVVVMIGTVHDAGAVLSELLTDDRVEVGCVVTNTRLTARNLPGAVDVATAAAAAGVPALLTDDVNGPQVVASIRALHPDLIVVAGCPQLLGTKLLAVPRRGCVGFHPSLLPRYRGPAPINWAMLRGERTVGNTLLMLDRGRQTGDIIAQREIAVRPQDTFRSVYLHVANAGARMLREHLAALLAGQAPRQAQDPAAGDVLPPRTPEMGIIDWNRSAAAIYDWVRALTLPYSGAFTHYNGGRAMVWAAQAATEEAPSGWPGEILDYERDGVRIGVRGGSVLITQMSDPGHRPEPARRWLRRARLAPGFRFEPVPLEVSLWALGQLAIPTDAHRLSS
ncbi:MAG: methionyl-tRNA formyltransferase [Jatrophihabitantaceae bacterium]